jgi:hypothetical protein
MVFEYLQYTAWRPKRKNGAYISKDGANGDELRKVRRKRNPFNCLEYEKVMAMLAKKAVSKTIDAQEEEVLKEQDLVESINKHYFALLEHAPEKVKEKMRIHQGMKNLWKEVIGRQKHIQQTAFKEKVNPQLEKFNYKDYAQLAEKAFWNQQHKAKNLSSLAIALRHRYHLLTTCQTLAQHESCISDKLSNFTLVYWKMEGEQAEYPVLFRNIEVAKNCSKKAGKNTTIQCKSIRHKNVLMCEQGALAMYLHARFALTEEEFDFSHGSNWFNILTTVDVSPKGLSQFDNTKTMTTQAFYDALVKVFVLLGVKPHHVIYFGRCMGSALLELCEVPDFQICALGN